MVVDDEIGHDNQLIKSGGSRCNIVLANRSGTPKVISEDVLMSACTTLNDTVSCLGLCRQVRTMPLCN